MTFGITSSADTRAGQRRAYRVHGLRVSSDLPLPIPECVSPETDDLVARLMDHGSPRPTGKMVAWAPCPLHGMDTAVYRGTDGTWIWQRAVATCHVHPDLKAVDIYPESGIDPEALALLIMGPVCTYVLLRRGVPVLHATAVVMQGRAVAFVGSQGQGKSTMASFLLSRGARLLTDDSLPLVLARGQVLGEPSVPLMKLWPQTAQHALGLSEDLPQLMCGYDKRRLLLDERWQLVEQAVPVDAVYMLRRQDPATCHDIKVTVLEPTQAFTELLSHISNRSYLLPEEEARLVPVIAHLSRGGRVRVLTYPSGFEHADAVYRSIVNDLGGEA